MCSHVLSFLAIGAIWDGAFLKMPRPRLKIGCPQLEVLMDLKKLNVFLTVADLGNFTKAGEALGYTQSGITQMMKSLEHEAGVPLFIKSHHGVKLTEEGLCLIP